MAEWSERTTYDVSYFNELRAAIVQGTFPDPRGQQNDVAQVGVCVVERVDLVLQDPPDQSTKAAALDAFLTAVGHLDEHVATHLELTLLGFGYKGLLDKRDADIEKLWTIIVEQGPGGFLQKIGRNVLRVKKLGSMLTDVSVYQSEDKDIPEIMTLLMHRYGFVEATEFSEMELI